MKKHLVITGGSRGIGLATAMLFQESGYHVINVSRSDIPLPGATQMCADFLGKDWLAGIAEPLIKCLRDSTSIAVIHNAGVLSKGSALTLDQPAVERVMAVNVVAPALLNALVFPVMPKTSSITYVGSTLSEKAVANSAAYVASKHAVVGLMRSTCQDLVDTDIHTSCVCPGFTDTEMLKEHLGNDPAVIQAASANVTQHRLLEPKEIASTLYFCATTPAINGSVIHANLGQVEH